MTDIKIVAQFDVRGGVMHTEQECAAMPSGGYDAHFLRLSYQPHPHAKEVRHETVKYLTRTFRPASQVIKMSGEAYDDMMLNPPCGWHRGRKEWNSLSRKMRIDAHMDAMAADLNAVSYTYHIAED